MLLVCSVKAWARGEPSRAVCVPLGRTLPPQVMQASMPLLQCGVGARHELVKSRGKKVVIENASLKECAVMSI